RGWHVAICNCQVAIRELGIRSFGPVVQDVELADNGAAGGEEGDNQGRGGRAFLGRRERDVARAGGGDVDLEDDVARSVFDLEAAAGGSGGVAPGDAAEAMLDAGGAGGVADLRLGARGAGDGVAGAVEDGGLVLVDGVGDGHGCSTWR